jgi:hypothetical protein
VAESRQFGGPKIRQFGDKPGGDQPNSGDCAQCENMLADALDGTLSAADQKLFDSHMVQCGPCAQLLADAQRGVAWLEMLRHPKPEPPAMLVERILAQTSGAAGQMLPVPMPQTGILVPQPSAGSVVPTATSYTNVIPFRSRFAAAVRSNSFGQIMLQPRLAMTAAMAFFSIALTMNLTGVRLQDLHASDLRPSSIKRGFYHANARVVQYYEGLRVVYELESRVHDLQSDRDNNPTVGSQSTPAAAAPDTNEPGSQAQPDPAKQDPGTQPEKKQRPASGPHSGTGAGPGAAPSPNWGTSHREVPGRMLSVASTLEPGDEMNELLVGPMESTTPQALEGRLV